MLKIVLFFNNFNTLGHAEIVFNLARGLRDRFNNRVKIIVIETGTKKIGIFPFQRYCNYYYLPLTNPNQSPIDTESKFILKNNIHKIKKIIDSFKPDIFVTELYPFVEPQDFFLYPHLLEHVKNTTNAKIISISSYLNYTDRLAILLDKYYDKILFSFPEELLFGYKHYLNIDNAAKLQKILDKNGKKIEYMGFISSLTVAPQENPNKYIIKKIKLVHKKLILVSRGGRTEYRKLIDYSIQIAKRNKNLFFVISTGPSLPKNTFQKYSYAVKQSDNILLSKTIYPGFDHLLKIADLCINMGGYNTAVKLLQWGKRAIIFPTKNTEQIWHAFLLKRSIPCEIVSAPITCDLLSSKISKLLKINKVQAKKQKSEWFSGLRNTVTALSNTRKRYA